MTITLTRVDGALWINPAPPYITDYLKYSHRSFGLEGWRRVNKFEVKLLHQPAAEGGVITFQGFFEKLCRMIHKHGDLFVVDDQRTPIGEPNLQAIKDINWEAIDSTGPLGYQLEPIVDFLYRAKDNSGIANATGGWGKTVLQAVTYAAYNHLNTILAIPLKEVFKQTHKKFQLLFPNKHIGMVGDGHCDISQDITVTTFKSLPKCATEKCQLLLVDEIQGTTGEKVLDSLIKLHPIRCFGYTATDQNLFNGADKVIKGLFGERLIHIPYEDAEADGAVVPATVYFIKTPDNIVVAASSMDGKLDKGIRLCQPRNRLIGQVCCKVPDNWQTLVFVDHIENHLIPLMKEMPLGTKYLHRGTTKRQFGDYALTNKQQSDIAAEFQDNGFQFLVATDAFRAGVDIPNCRVVVQGAGGTSEVEILQEAYRGSRVLRDAHRERLGVEPKTHFVLIDFLDQHDHTLEGMSMKRMEIYKKQGWTIRTVDSIDEIDWYAHGPESKPAKKL